VNSSRSESPQINVFHFPPFVLGFISIFVLDEFHPQIRDDPSSYGNQSSIGFSLSRFVSDFGVFPSEVRLCVIPSKANYVALFYSHNIEQNLPFVFRVNCGALFFYHKFYIKMAGMHFFVEASPSLDAAMMLALISLY